MGRETALERSPGHHRAHTSNLEAHIRGRYSVHLKRIFGSDRKPGTSRNPTKEKTDRLNQSAIVSNR